MAKKELHTADSYARVRVHQFGTDGGNKRGNPYVAVAQREFYRWVETRATLEELRKYVADETNPAARRQFVQCLMKCNKVQDFFDLTNQTHGYPKQEISMDAPPKIVIEWDVD